MWNSWWEEGFRSKVSWQGKLWKSTYLIKITLLLSQGAAALHSFLCVIIVTLYAVCCPSSNDKFPCKREYISITLAYGNGNLWSLQVWRILSKLWCINRKTVCPFLSVPACHPDADGLPVTSLSHRRQQDKLWACSHMDGGIVWSSGCSLFPHLSSRASHKWALLPFQKEV